MKQRLVFVLVVVLVLVACTVPMSGLLPVTGIPETLPWTLFSDAAKSSAGARLGYCEVDAKPVAILVADLSSPAPDVTYRFYYAEETRRVVWAAYQEGDPIRLWFGSVDPRAIDVIVTESSRLYDERRDSAGPCPYLFPRTT